jgi:hypothetical protein
MKNTVIERAINIAEFDRDRKTSASFVGPAKIIISRIEIENFLKETTVNF